MANEICSCAPVPVPPPFPNAPGCSCGQGGSGVEPGQSQSPSTSQDTAAQEEEEDIYTQNEKILIITRNLVQAMENISADLPKCVSRISSGRERGNETVVLTVTIK